MGLPTMPASDRLTRSTCPAWSSIGRLRCSTPTPPWRAMAIAMRDSVTVSIALETNGIRTAMLRVTLLDVSTSLGTISDAPGSNRTSSKVRPCKATFPSTSPEPSPANEPPAEGLTESTASGYSQSQRTGDPCHGFGEVGGHPYARRWRALPARSPGKNAGCWTQGGEIAEVGDARGAGDLRPDEDRSRSGSPNGL